MTEKTPRTPLSIDQWVQELAAIPPADFFHDNVQRFIETHSLLSESLEPYTFFSKDRYTRNLIFKNSTFECLAMCWDVGQSSGIHDHNDRLGWMYLASGRLFIQNYRIESRDATKRTCRLEPTNSVELNSAQASDVDREHGVHKVCNLSKFGERAVSIHVYQLPMDTCAVYSLEWGTYDIAKLSYTTEYGLPANSRSDAKATSAS